MTRAQKTILIVLTIAIALTRLLAVSRSLFDWDEALFTLGVRDYDVTQHHPHPPGYPLFIAAAKAIHLLGVPEFRSLQVIVVLGAIALFPALFFLAREIGFDFATSACGAAVYAFLPNVWVYGGTGFSDIPATALVFAACALLLAGRRDPRAYVLGAAVLGLAAGMRPTNLLIGALPALIATWHRRSTLKHILLAIVLGGAIVAASYAGAALATGTFDAYLEAVEGQSRYVREVDSFRNPERAPLREMAEIFFLWPVQQRQQMVGLAALATASLIVSIVKKRRAPWLLFATFAPFAIVAWLNLDYEAAARYAIPYMAVHALLAADALGIATRQKTYAHAAACAAIVVVFTVWTWPALQLQRTRESPPAAALEWVRHNLPKEEPVYVTSWIGPQAQAIIPDRNNLFYDDPRQITLMSDGRWILGLDVVEDSHAFVWPRNALWKILRRRNFEASVRRTHSKVVFVDGWHGDEGGYRWTKGESTTILPPLQGPARLSLRMYVPIETMPAPPAIEIRMNGVTIERFAATKPIGEKSWTVPSRADAPNELQMTTSATVNPARLGRSGDARDLGLRVDALSWSPIR